MLDNDTTLIEEHVCKIIRDKLHNLGSLNNGDIGAYHIDGLDSNEKSLIRDTTHDKVTDIEYKRARIEVLMERRNRLLAELNETNQELAKLSK